MECRQNRKSTNELPFWKYQIEHPLQSNSDGSPVGSVQYGMHSDEIFYLKLWIYVSLPDLSRALGTVKKCRTCLFIVQLDEVFIYSKIQINLLGFT